MRNGVRTSCIWLIFVALCPIGILAHADEISFNRDVRPILADICFNCHGPDAAANEGGVRLDELKFAILEGDSGEPTVVPGDADKSELIRRVMSMDDPMPPSDYEKQLTENQKETLRRWIEQGAKYEGHWAFIKPTRPALPKVKNEGWVKNPVDRFILGKLELAELSPEKEASKRTLIRRLALDLTGLPPTPEEVAAFVNDDSSDAYEKLVDHYLSSTSFGEKMAAPWLDYARYADSNGFQSDGSRDIWAWREWVINAYNRNLPFDRFTIEQLAGDMLPNPTRAQVIATGFNRNHRLNGEGGRIVDEWFVETVIDRVETTGMTWLGLTFNCCRCHDHKYDPISQKEFYQFFAFFNSVEESGVLAPAGKNGENTPPLLQLTTPAHDRALAQFDDQVADNQKILNDLIKNESSKIEQWVSSLDTTQTSNPWQTGQVRSIKCEPKGTKFKKQPDGSYLATGKNHANPVYEAVITLNTDHFSGLMIEAFPHESLPNKFLGRSKSNGNFVLTDIVCEIETDAGKRIPVKFVRAQADFEQPNWNASKVLIEEGLANKNGSKKGWATIGFDASSGAPNRILFATDQRMKVSKKDKLHVKLYHRSIYANHAIGRLRFQVSGSEPVNVALDSAGVPATIQKLVSKPKKEWSKQEQGQVQKYYREQVSAEYRQAKSNIDQLRKSKKDYFDRLPTTMVMKEGNPRDAFILDRGEYDKPTEKVGRALPAFLPPMPNGEPMDRLGLARWIVDESNPLTSRVWVNRTWESLFGTGIVKSTENFGTQADYPTHPELLDWLAVEFMNPESLPDVNGVPAQRWDMKAFIKMLVTSAAYRQASTVRPEKLERDPENRLLARGPRFRLGGEAIRDQALAVSGLLVDQIGGPSVRPYMPEGVWDETSVYGNLRNYKADKGEGRYRRTLYTIWKRTAGPPTMLLFDAPNRETCIVKRSRTNTPLQALSLLNENTFVEAAQALANRMIVEGGQSPETRIQFAFELLTARQPSEHELSILVAGFLDDFKTFEADENRASEFLKSVNPELLASVDPCKVCEFAAYALTANVLLNLDEVITRE